ncbi:MAG: hypothetical protein R3F38_20295 [Gammaproteobacteria bacterium]
MDLSTQILNVLTICIGLAFLIAIGKLMIRLFKVLFGLSRATGNLLRPGSGPNPDAVELFQGQIVDARNWHAAGGGFYAEFWLKDQQGMERRYKLSGIHPELRKGHRVTLYEYAGTLVAIKNDSTSQNLWVVPDGLLASLYPTGRRRNLTLWSLGLGVIYVLLKPDDHASQEMFFTLMLLIFIGCVLTLLFKHLFTSRARRAERLNKFSEFCYQAMKSR